MIIDSHAYCFPPLDSQGGFSSVEEHLREVQMAWAYHHQPVWRLRDGMMVNENTLVDSSTGHLRDVKWGRDLGRLTWTLDGEIYTKQYLPPMLHNLEGTPEVLLAEMDYAGVDMAILHQSPALGKLNDYLSEIIMRFPNRFRGLISVWEADIPSDPYKAIRELKSAVEGGRLSALQFHPTTYYRSDHDDSWDDGVLRSFWTAVAQLDIPVFFTIGARSEDLSGLEWNESYLEELCILQKWMDRYPGVITVITHGLPWRSFFDGSHIAFPEDIWRIFETPQCHLQLLIPIRMGDIWEYPYVSANAVLQECVERIGVERLMWGTDMPILGRFCTYSQALDHIQVHSKFLNACERRSMLGGTIAKVLKL